MDENEESVNGSDERTPAAGTHLLADFWGVTALDAAALERAVRAAVDAAGATLLELAFHQFPGHGGVTGYALLAESHLGVHTWPERDYAAIDVFMCGTQRPERALEVLRRALRPARETVRAVRRGEWRDADDRGRPADAQASFSGAADRPARRTAAAVSDASSARNAP